MKQGQPADFFFIVDYAFLNQFVWSLEKSFETNP